MNSLDDAIEALLHIHSNSPHSWREICSRRTNDALGAIMHVLVNNEAVFHAFTDDALQKWLEEFFFSAREDGINFVFKLAHRNPQARMLLFGLSYLFTGVLRSRCKPKTSAGRGTAISGLNNLCYMFWDSFPYRPGDGIEVTEYGVISSMVSCVYSGHVAIAESGLHGIGHWVQRPGGDIVLDCLGRIRTDFFCDELKIYAEDAFAGRVQ